MLSSQPCSRISTLDSTLDALADLVLVDGHLPTVAGHADPAFTLLRHLLDQAVLVPSPFAQVKAAPRRRAAAEQGGDLRPAPTNESKTINHPQALADSPRRETNPI